MNDGAIIDAMLNEIERTRLAIQARTQREIRNGVIEECVRVAQQWLIRAEQGSGEDLLDGIRALKTKPEPFV